MKKIGEFLTFLLPILVVAGAGYAIAILRPDIIQKTATFTFITTFMVLVLILMGVMENVIPEKWKKAFDYAKAAVKKGAVSFFKNLRDKTLGIIACPLLFLLFLLSDDDG